MMKKILLINPPYDGIEGHGGKNAPLNLAYLASYLRENKKGVEIAIIDAEGLELSFEQIYERVDAFSPDLIGITCPTPVYYNVRKMVADLKEKDKGTKIVLGGPHPTALPEDTLGDTAADIVVVGEGELVFFDLVNALEKGADLSGVRGIGYRDSSGRIVINDRRDLIPDLDVLPFPAKDLLPQERYYLPPTKRIRSSRATNMVGSRGCSFDCTFCMAKVMWRRRVRLRSIPNVIEEIELNVKEFGLTEFSFHDELFTIKKKRVMEFCRAVVDRGLDITWVCQARVGSVDLEVLKMMKQAGCGKIAFGFESGSQQILDLMKKRQTLAQAIESVDLCNKAEIEVGGAFILGYPGEEEKDIESTIRFALALDCDTVAFFIAIPYPGTELYRIALERGYISKDVNWGEFAPVSNLASPMMLPNISQERLQCYKKKAYYRYYLRPRYVVRKLGKVRSFGDVVNLASGFKIFRKLLWGARGRRGK